MSADIEKLQKLWNMATEQMKKRVSSIAVWQAMESAVVLDYEEGVLVVGLGGENFSRSGHIEVPDRRNMIEQILTQITGRPLSYRLVECGSLEDWQTYKIHEERKRAASMALATGQRPPAEALQTPGVAPAAVQPAAVQPAAAPVTTEAVRNVDDILDRAYKLFQALPHRTLSQSRARFIRDAAQMLAGAEGQLAATGMPPDTIARTIDRAIDRIAVWGECDSTTVALEYLRHKER